MKTLHLAWKAVLLLVVLACRSNAHTFGPLGPVYGPVGYQKGIALPRFPAELGSHLDALNPRPSILAPRPKGRLQIGINRSFDSPIVLNSSTVKPQEWSLLSNGWRVWSAELISEGAVGVRVHIESLALPAGVRLVAYDPARPTSVARPIDAQSLKGEREAWTSTLFTERVVVECQAPPGANLDQIIFSLTGVSHLYRSPLVKDMAEACELNATCYPAWAPQAAGVARISFVDSGNAFLCTGSLIGDSTGLAPAATSAGAANYFLTANHCVSNQRVASTIEFDWFYEAPTCQNPNPPDNWPTTGGGATFLAGVDDMRGSDFAFMRLREPPPDGANRLGWSRTTPSNNETLTVIEHPRGDYKRIAFGSLIGGDPLQLGPDFWMVQWSQGVTEEGSSGSPLFNSGQQIIGQLWGGTSDCSDTTGPDGFGRFDITYAAIKRWIVLQGTYYGLFSDPAGVQPQSAGSFTLTTTGTGKFSGSLQLGNARYPISGQLDANGNAQITVSRHSLGPLGVALQVDLTGGSDQVLGTVTSTNEDWTANLMGDRAIFDGKSFVCPLAGSYTLLIPGSDSIGNSYGTLSVSKTGKISFTGFLADGTPISQTSYLSKNGEWPFNNALYSGQGIAQGWLGISSPTGSLSGTVSWIKPFLPKAKYYSGGLTNVVDVTGSYYDRTLPVLGFNTGDAVLSGGGLPGQIVSAFSLDAHNHVTNLSASNKFALSFTVATGAFTGSVAAPASSKPVKFGGVVVQNNGTGAGAFLGTQTSGTLVLQGQ
ncbi:MAG: hypothetical protein C5B50_15170 [Verrucomicrobia bacterium]|nr:MAG: hypothetical protein C5B50_15170 [Verrucomicrobiota bacterium]